MNKAKNKTKTNKLLKRFSIHLKEQNIKLPVENIDECVEKKNVEIRHSSLLPM